MEGRTIENDPILSLLYKSIKKLDFFIRNITNYYKNSKIEKRIDEINFSSIVNETIYALPFVEETPVKEVDFDIQVDQKEPFFNDEFRVRVILNNILSNAIKYQRQDNVEKKVSVLIQTREDGAMIKIKDNGIGIPQDLVDKIFDMFFRGTSVSNGSGIGLYIVKEAVNKIAGDIKVISQEGEGTEFIISIPNIKVPQPENEISMLKTH
ncbi:MAG TPA: HAMP domain-containing sensor histidine kinase [Cytophagaceae bacterium]